MDKHEQIALFDEAPRKRSYKKTAPEISQSVRLNYMCLQKIAAERLKIKFQGGDVRRW